MIKIDEYEEMLKAHDWNYEFTEDRKCWSAGNISYQEIIKYSTDSKQHAKLFFKYKKEHGTKN